MQQEKQLGHIVLAGGSGFLGTSLAYYLTQHGAKITVLSRSHADAKGPWNHVYWDGRTLGPWQETLEGTAVLINLVGRSVDCPKTPDHQDEIIRSRVEATLVLGKALRNLASPPPVWLQMGTAHIYGDPPEVICDEDSPYGLGLGPVVGQAWEAAFHQSLLPNQRGVIFRIGFVLGRDRGAGNGALGKLSTLTRLGLGGTIASGKQGYSWIHELDYQRLVLRAIENPDMQGAYNICGPNPIAQRDFMRALRKAIGMPFGLPATTWMAHLGAKFILRTDVNLALYGRYVVSKRLAQEGFQFQFPDIQPALNDLLSKK